MTDLTGYIGDDHKVVVVRLDGGGWVKSIGRINPDVYDAHMAANPGLVSLTAAQAAILDGSPWFRMVGGILLKQEAPEEPIERARARAIRAIDQAAESARQLWITPGSGQAMEYQESSDEAARAIAAADPLDPADYPWLAAEQAAQAQVGQMLTIRQVAQITAGTRAAWVSAGSTIKELRRAAKLRVAEATTPGEVDAAVGAIQWPTP